jgi:hypothetical protein
MIFPIKGALPWLACAEIIALQPIIAPLQFCCAKMEGSVLLEVALESYGWGFCILIGFLRFKVVILFFYFLFLGEGWHGSSFSATQSMRQGGPIV